MNKNSTLIIIKSIFLFLSFNNICFASGNNDEIDNLKHHSFNAYKIIEKHYARHKSGLISEADAQEQAKFEVQKYRFDASNYINIYDMRGKIITSAREELIGMDLSNLKDLTGKPIFKEVIKSAISGNGLTEYQWPKPGQRQASTKIQFSRYFKPWNWIISTGTYSKHYDDIESRRNFIIALSIIELYKNEFGFYPNSTSELVKLDPVLCELVCEHAYSKLENGYSLKAPNYIENPHNIRIQEKLIKHPGF